MAKQGAGGISWTQQTWNPIRGCRRLNGDCINCYAESVATRFSGPGGAYEGLVTADGRWNGIIRTIPAHLSDPLHWLKSRLIFVNSMSDLFYDGLSEEEIDAIVAVMVLAHWHTFEVLTKRPERMAYYLRTAWPRIKAKAEEVAKTLPVIKARPAHPGLTWPATNIWWGASMGHQMAADKLLNELVMARDHAAVLWVSAEPLWQRTKFYAPDFAHVDWLVTGGESGDGARHMEPAWAREHRDLAGEMGKAFHFKQWGEWAPIPEHVAGGLYRTAGGVLVNPTLIRDTPSGVMGRVGKPAAGRLLDGVEHNAYPAGWAEGT